MVILYHISSRFFNIFLYFSFEEAKASVSAFVKTDAIFYFFFENIEVFTPSSSPVLAAY